MSAIKVYRRHNCESRHRTFRTLAKCIWPEARWVLGDGPYATAAYCHGTTVMLHPTSEQAESALTAIRSFGCGGGCTRRHDLVVLVLPDALADLL